VPSADQQAVTKADLRAEDGRLLKHELVVKAKLALWRARKVCPHQDLAVDVGPEDGSCEPGAVIPSAISQRGRRHARGRARDAPVELISRLTVSMTSTKASFLRYLTSARRQLVLPVAWMVILDESSRCKRGRTSAGQTSSRQLWRA
jgi:hypothetical protein